MDVHEAIKAGRLGDALALTKQAIRQAPADAGQRSLLFQLLCLSGNRDAAATQLKLVGELDPTAALFVGVSEKILACEEDRAQVFCGGRGPILFGEPEAWMAGMIAAFQLGLNGNWEAAASAAADALEGAPATPASLRGQKVEWIADADSRLGPLLEAFIDGRYYWVPFQRIRQLTLRPRTHLADVIWAPVDFLWTNEGKAAGFIPVRYPGSENSADPLIQLGRKTEWRQRADGLYEGSGQRTMTTSEAEFPFLELDSVRFFEAESTS